MTPIPSYSLDTNVFIEAKNRYYAFDLCPGFWEVLVWQHGQGSVGSIDRVLKELKEQHDELTDWASTVMPGGCFASTDEDDVAARFAELSVWVNGQHRFTEGAKAKFLDGADSWLVAYAAAKGTVVVTHEQPAPEARKIVKIPDACLALNVGYVDSFDMLRALATEFRWASDVQ